MSQLLLNAVIRDTTSNQCFRAVWQGNDQVIFFTLHSDPYSQCRKLRLRAHKLEEVNRWLEAGKMVILEEHAYHPATHQPERLIPTKITVVKKRVIIIEDKGEMLRTEDALRIRDRRHRAVSDVIALGLDILLGKSKSQALADVAKRHGTSRQILGKWLGLFLTLGMTPDALVPRFDACGGKGKHKAIGEAKRGAPSILGDGGGCNITPELAEKMNNFIAAKMKTGAEVPELFQEFSETECIDGKTIGPNGEILFNFKPQSERPTIEIFEKHYHDVDYQEKMIALYGEREWTNRFREILGSEGARAQMPGACYQIDFHVPDIELRHPYYPVKIGRGSLGAVHDVASPMIAGSRFSMAHSSTQEALLLMQSAFLPKVPYCELYGVEIQEEQWPVHGLCSRAFADNGELGTRRAGQFFGRYHIALENERAYNPTDKGTVERYFGVLEEHEIKMLPGNTRGERQFGDPKCPLDGKISPEAMQQIFILAVLKRLKEENYDKFMPTDAIRKEIAPSALGLWQWSKARGLGLLREVPDKKILSFSTLPTLHARIKGNGLNFKKLHYVSRELNGLSFFSKRRRNSEWVMVAYEPNLIDYIYVVENGKVYRLQLAQKEMAMYGEQRLSFADMDLIFEKKAKGKIEYRRRQKLQIDSDHRALINLIVAEEEDRAKHLNSPVAYSFGETAVQAQQLQAALVRKAHKKAAAVIIAPGGQKGPAEKPTSPVPKLRLLPEPGATNKKSGQPAPAAKPSPPKPADPNIEFLRSLRRKKL